MTLVEAEKELKLAMEAHETACAEQQEASRRETAARNRLNNSQKAFDAAVQEIRKIAPPDSDWFRATHER